MFGNGIDWGCNGGNLACYAGDVDDCFRGGFCFVLRLGREEVGEGELGGADWVGKVDVEACVAVGGGRVG